jgi:hypothetical protein
MCRLHLKPFRKKDEVMQLPLKQRTLYEETSPSFCGGRKFDEVEQALLWRLLQQAPQCPSRVLLAKATEQHVVIAVSLRQVNRWRAAQGLSRGQGRPRRAEVYQPVACGAEVVQMTLHLSCVPENTASPVSRQISVPR